MIYPHKERMYMAAKLGIWFLSLCVLLSGTCMGNSAHPLAPFGWMVLLGVAIAPHILVRRSIKRFIREADEKYSAFLGRVNPTDHNAYALGTGIAINNAKKEISLLQDDESKTYSFSDVRSWSWNIETPGRVIATGSLQAHSQAHAENLRMALNAKERTGLFINTKDINHPVWHVRLLSRPMIDRWTEILNQSLGDAAS